MMFMLMFMRGMAASVLDGACMATACGGRGYICCWWCDSEADLERAEM